MATYNGAYGNVNDNKAGSAGADLFLFAGGDDRAVAGAGDDVVFVGLGNDKVEAGTGDDLVDGGFGDDIIDGGAGNDILLGGAGNDKFDGGVGNDIMSGGSGSDTFNFTKGFGDDTITDFTFGGPEGDRINIYAGALKDADGNTITKNITIKTIADIQALIDNGIADLTESPLGHGAAVLTFKGGAGSLTFLNYEAAFSGSVSSTGNSGDNTLITGAVHGNIVANGGNDTALAGSGGANINGGEGNDKLIGGAGNDLIGGGAGDDYLFGNGGNDILDGGVTGNDFLSGGDGKDVFQFRAGFGHDTVTDLDFADDVLTFVNTGITDAKTIRSIEQLQAMIDDGGFTVTHEGDNALITFDPSHSIKLVGYATLIPVTETVVV